MNSNEATLQITRSKGHLSGVNVIMPVWSRIGQDGKVYIKIPLFGIETVAKDEEDSETAIKESLESFCLISEEFGSGLESELEAIGWKLQDNSSKKKLLFNLVPDNLAFESIMDTGEQTALSLQMCG